MGQCYERHRHPAQIFERCLKEFPSSERRPDAMLNLARAYLLGEQNEKARKLLRALIAEFPESEISRKGELIVNLR